MNLFETKSGYESGDISKQDYIDQMFQHHQQIFDYSQFIKNTDIAKIEIVDGALIFTSRTDGVKIVCQNNDKRFAPNEILNFGAYELVESDMIMRLVPAEGNVFDIGANIGWYSITIARRYPNANIFAFEPIPQTFDALKKNAAVNQVKNLRVYDFGFSNVDGELKFYCYPGMSVNASSANLTGGTEFEEITSFVKRLDNFTKEQQVKIDFLKCDVEGAELLVFQGGMESISRDKPVIFSEMLRKWSAKFNYHPNAIIDLFASIGYQCFTVQGDKLFPFKIMDENTVETNFFFLHAEKHQTQIDQLVVRK